jgi:hypothetical protein
MGKVNSEKQYNSKTIIYKNAKQIVTGGGHYFLSVKGNQRELPEDAECAFRTHSCRI